MPTISDEAQAYENIVTDAALWYDVGIFGQLGYAIPNPSNDVGTLNLNIYDLTNLIGRNLFAIMHHEDTALSRPPSVNTLHRIHQLYVRSGQLLSGRAIPPGEPNLEVEHVTPAGEIFRVYPVPYFLVRNPHLKRWCNYVLICLSECMQHTENRKAVEVSTDFAAMVGKYMQRIYSNMAVELFGKTREEANASGFLLTQEDFSSYNPGAFFTSVEMVDTVPALDNVLTEDRKAHLAAGILVTDLPVLKPYPNNLTMVYERIRAAKNATVNPDTGQQDTDGSRVDPRPVFPQGGSFV